MTGFLIVMGVMMALGMAFVLLPLTRQQGSSHGMPRLHANLRIHRDQLRQLEVDRDTGIISQDEFESEQRELGRRAIEDALAALREVPAVAPRAGVRPVAMALAMLIPFAATGLYLTLGSPDSVAVAAAAPATGDVSAQTSPHGMTFDQIRESATRLAERLQAHPDDGEGWAMLARSWNVLGRYQQAAGAYEKAVALLPSDAQLLADYADALAMSQGQKLDGKPLEIVRHALKIDPANLKALALAGTAAFDRKDYREAVEYWEKVIRIAPPDSEFARSLQGSLEDARARMEGRPPVAALPDIMPARPASAGAARTGAGISGDVELAPNLLDRVRADDTVFVFARAEQGPRMPLAIATYKAGELPLHFKLDDASAMSPNRKLSAAGSVKLVARISRSGNATAQRGDLEGVAGPVKPGSQGVRIRIDNVVP